MSITLWSVLAFGVLAVSFGSPTTSEAQRVAAVTAKLADVNPFLVTENRVDDPVCQHCDQSDVITDGVTWSEHSMQGACHDAFAALDTRGVPENTRGGPLFREVLDVSATLMFTGTGCRRCGGSSSTCHSSYDDGVCHILCGPGGGDDLAVVLAEAVRKGQTQLVAQMVARASDLVRVNVQRSALQIIGCKGALIAAIPLPEATSRRIASVGADQIAGRAIRVVASTQ